MCGLCGALGGGDWTDGVADGQAAIPAHVRRAQRRQRIALANRVLRPAGLALGDWQGAALLLRGRTGATAIVPGLASLWQHADRLGTAPIDPLDPLLLDALERG